MATSPGEQSPGEPVDHPTRSDAPIGGNTDPRFAPLRDAFASNFTPSDGDPGDLGAALAVVIDGRTVVDLWGGWREPAQRTLWQRDTLVNVYSVGKAVASAVILVIAERGELDLDRPVSTWWPELEAGRENGLSLRQVLSHRAGLPAIRQPMSDTDLFDWPTITAALARSEPWWTPGTAHGYHTNTLGFLVGEPARRVRGTSFGKIAAELVTSPARADVHVGLAPASHSRVATVDLGAGPPVPATLPDLDDPVLEMRHAAYFNPPGFSGFGTVNTARWRSAEIPSTNPHATAIGVARLFASLVGAGPEAPLLGRGMLHEATTVHSSGHDLVLDRDSRFGLGMMLPQDGRPIGVGPNSFGHYGFGGTLGFADPDANIGFGYVINRPGDRWQVPRTRRLLAALRECL